MMSQQSVLLDTDTLSAIMRQHPVVMPHIQAYLKTTLIIFQPLNYGFWTALLQIYVLDIVCQSLLNPASSFFLQFRQ